MKRFTRLGIVAATFALASAGAAHADTESLMNECIDKFVATQFAGFNGKVTVKKNLEPAYPAPLVLRRHRITVSAVDAASGAPLATATCKPGKDGLLVTIKSKTPPAKVARTDTPDVAKPDATLAADAG